MIKYIEKRKDKRIIAISNPPYHECFGIDMRRVKSIYSLFINSLLDSTDEFLTLTPSRWMKGARCVDISKLISRIQKGFFIKNITHFADEESIFPTVNIEGSVSLLHFDKNYSGEAEFIAGGVSRKADLSEFDIILTDQRGARIVRKVLEKWKGEYMDKHIMPWDVFKLREELFIEKKTQADEENTVPCLHKKGKIFYISKKDISSRGLEIIDSWKVICSIIFNPRRSFKNNFRIVPPGMVVAVNSRVVFCSKNKKEAIEVVKCLRSDMTQYLLQLRRCTTRTLPRYWKWVPVYTPTENDKNLYKFFGITDDEVAHINKKLG